MFNRKGVELTMSTIIIAVLVILVLIVLILIFNKSVQNFFLGTSSCTSHGGECMSGSCDQGYSNYFTGNPECQSSQGEGSICCKRNEAILDLEVG